MKNKFERLSKEDKKKALEEFKDSNERNANVYIRIKRLKIVGIIGIVYSILMFVLDFLKEWKIFDYGFSAFDNLIASYIIDGCLLVFCVFFFIKARKMLQEQVNKYLIEQKKK